MSAELKGWDESDFGYHIEVPSIWKGPAYLGPRQSIPYWVSHDGTEGIMISVYVKGQDSLDQLANEKRRLVESSGLPLDLFLKINIGIYPAYQIGFSEYTSVLAEANGRIYDLGLYGNVKSYPTLEKVLASFSIRNPHTTPNFDIASFLVGMAGMNESFRIARNAIRCSWPNRCEYR